MTSNILKRYWRIYGGFGALLKSPYFWVSALITILLYPSWSVSGWWDDVLSIMPNLLGFSLGGYAMWIAIGDDEFRKLISGEDGDGKPSPYMEVNAAFVHFIVLQMLAMILALVNKAYDIPLNNQNILVKFLGDAVFYVNTVSYFVSYFVFIYALLTAVAATLSLFRVSSYNDNKQTNERKKT